MADIFQKSIYIHKPSTFEIGGYFKNKKLSYVNRGKSTNYSRKTFTSQLFGIIDSYIFENTFGEAVIVNSINYRQIMTDFCLEFNNIIEEGVWFQQVDPTLHFQNKTFELLKEKCYSKKR